MRQQGRPLSLNERNTFKPYFPQVVIEQARIIEDAVPIWLRQNMCAVALQHRIYFRAGAYQPDTKRGIALLGHELVHVSQFLHGMTLLKYIWSCRYGYQHSAYEIEAYAKGAMIARDVGKV